MGDGRVVICDRGRLVGLDGEAVFGVGKECYRRWIDGMFCDLEASIAL